MTETFDRSLFRGYIIRGELRPAMEYLKIFPDRAAEYEKYRAVFEEGAFPTPECGGAAAKLLRPYQTYYREVFYLGVDKEMAEEHLRQTFAELLGLGADTGLETLEEHVAEAFEAEGWRFLGGRTSGYLGPYVWRETEARTYPVELPDGAASYTVKLLDGFISRSWMDFLSLGEIGTGGWADGDGIINCVKSVYDLEGESFRVSLLKHEAQHAADLARYGKMESEDLEYRAKLVELIYSQERDLLGAFLLEADGSKTGNGHALAAERIGLGFAEKLGQDRASLAGLPVEEVQTVALALFRESTAEMAGRYGG